jgi:hypothetical protein
VTELRKWGSVRADGGLLVRFGDSRIKLLAGIGTGYQRMAPVYNEVVFLTLGIIHLMLNPRLAAGRPQPAGGWLPQRRRASANTRMTRKFLTFVESNRKSSKR